MIARVYRTAHFWLLIALGLTPLSVWLLTGYAAPSSGVAYISVSTPLLDGSASGAAVIGQLTPGTPLRIVSGGEATTQVEVQGWSVKGAESVVITAPGQRIVLLTLNNQGRAGRKSLKQTKDSAGNQWDQVSVTGWVKSSSLVADLDQVWKAGRQLFEQTCSSCHALHPTTEFGANEWPGVLQSMKENVALTNEQYALILRYVQAHAKGQ